MEGVDPSRAIRLPARGEPRLQPPIHIELHQVVKDQCDRFAALHISGERRVERGGVGGEKVLEPGAVLRVGAAARGKRKQRGEQISAH
jgi:hypothetical protein